MGNHITQRPIWQESRSIVAAIIIFKASSPKEVEKDQKELEIQRNRMINEIKSIDKDKMFIGAKFRGDMGDEDPVYKFEVFP